MNGTVASNFACPQGVRGGRDASSIPPMMATPLTFLSGNCIQTPLRSCDRAGAAEGVAEGGLAGVSFVAEGRLFCADNLGGQTVNIPKAASKTENCIAAGF